MPSIKQGAQSICARCLLRHSTRLEPNLFRHLVTSSKHLSANNPQLAKDEPAEGDKKGWEGNGGAMSRRLEEMTTEGIESNPRAASKIIEESGFSEELKARLEARIAGGKMKAENPAAFSLTDMPSSAGKGTRDNAIAAPWTGEEKLEESALRMLDDANPKLKPSLRGKPRLSNMSVDTRMKQSVKQSAGHRLGNARDKASVYTMTQDNNMNEQEKEEFRKIMKARFQPGARSLPQSIQGLQSLASERIEDAIARGLFKNIPRGKGVNVERDYIANSPFLDTTEYFMNKIIQKQEVLPPWVEKQQEITKQAAQFRSRLRNEWKRHAARTIASNGGTLEQQVRRAESFAKAEELINPRKVKQESMTTIDITGNLKHVMVSETPAVNSGVGAEITVTESISDRPSPKFIHIERSGVTKDTAYAEASSSGVETTAGPVPPAPYPFRDPTWESMELSYQTLALKSLNDLMRSYNLMAPELAKKPYFNLQRELKACFADVAPLLPNEIRERARRPPEKKAFVEIGHKKGGVMERFGGEKVRVYESTKPQYGFKEFWRDLFTKQ